MEFRLRNSSAASRSCLSRLVNKNTAFSRQFLCILPPTPPFNEFFGPFDMKYHGKVQQRWLPWFNEDFHICEPNNAGQKVNKICYVQNLPKLKEFFAQQTMSLKLFCGQTIFILGRRITTTTFSRAFNNPQTQDDILLKMILFMQSINEP